MIFGLNTITGNIRIRLNIKQREWVNKNTNLK